MIQTRSNRKFILAYFLLFFIYGIQTKAGTQATQETQEGELRFGFWCSDKKGYSNYFLNYTSFLKNQDYQSIQPIDSINEAQPNVYDVIINYFSSSFSGKLTVISGYSKKTLFEMKGFGMLGKDEGIAVYNAFKPGTELYNQVIAEREAYQKKQEQLKSISSGGISKEDIQDIVKAAVQGATEVQNKNKSIESAVPIRSDVDSPKYKNIENSNNFAVIIGIENYGKLPAAQFAGRDAEAVRSHLLALGYPQRNIVFMADQEATRAGIAKTINTWLPNRTNDNSTVFFYYSGHGAPDTKSNQAYLVPIDGDPEDLEDTGYSVKQLYQKLNGLKAKQIIVALDSCFSGAGGRSVLAKDARPLVNKIDTGTPGSGKVIAFSASNSDQISGAIEEQGHGAFTYYFLKGLNGDAADKNGSVTVKSLYGYLVPKVEDAARLHNRDQTPRLMPASSGEQVEIRLR